MFPPSIGDPSKKPESSTTPPRLPHVQTPIKWQGPLQSDTFMSFLHHLFPLSILNLSSSHTELLEVPHILYALSHF